MREYGKRIAGRWSHARCVALGSAASTLVALAIPWTAAHATPPEIVLVWIDRAGLEAAASPFGVEAQRAFASALPGVTARGMCGRPEPASGFECVEPWGLLVRVLPPLLCPAVQANRADLVEAFFAKVARRRLVRGLMSRLGDTAITFRLLRLEEGWQLAQVHRSVSPHAAGETREFHAHLGCSPGGTGVPSGAARPVPTT